MIELAGINSFLEILVKITVIALGTYSLFLLKNLNSFIQKAEASFESVEKSAEAVEKSVKWGKILPFIGGNE